MVLAPTITTRTTPPLPVTTPSRSRCKALKLDGQYTMFAPGSGAAQKAAIVSAYKRKRDIVVYYWTPTALVGSLDLVKLQLPAFDQAAYTCMTDPKCENPAATKLKPHKVVTGLNAERSEARRVRKECVRTCRSRWPQDH